MARFRYRVAGEPVSAGQVIEAPDRTAALRALVSRGVTPVGLEELRGRVRGGAKAAGRSGGAGLSIGGARTMSRGELANFVGELAVAVSAGLSVVPALKTLARSGRTSKQRDMLNGLISDVERGRSLADAMRDVGKPFNELLINMVHAGEVSGRLETVLAQAATLLERDMKLRRSLTGALVYPAILTVAIVIAVIVLVTVIVPRILSSVEGAITELPLPTMIVRDTAAFFGQWWWAVLLVTAAAVVAWVRIYRMPGPREAIDRFLLSVPVLGSLLRDVAVGRFTRTFGTLVGAGLPVLQALKITKRTLGNRALEREIDTVCDEVSHGKTIAEPLERSGYFPDLLVQIVGLGERTGKLDEVLLHAAGSFEERTEASAKLFTQVLPPILIVNLALVVGFVVLAVFLPLIELQDAIAQ